MTVTISNSYSQAVPKKSTSTTLSNVVVASGEVIYIFLAAGQKSGGAGKFATGITFNGSEAFSKVGTGQIEYDKSISEVWKLESPTATTADIVVTYTDNNSTWNGAVVGCYVLAGVTSDDGFVSNSGNATNQPIAIATESGDFTIAGISIQSTAGWNENGDGTEQWNLLSQSCRGASTYFTAVDTQSDHSYNTGITPADFTAVGVNLNTVGLTETIVDRDFELTVQVETIVDTDFELTVEHETITDTDFELTVVHETITDTDFELTTQVLTITDTAFELTVYEEFETITDTDFELTVQLETITDTDFELTVEHETIVDTDFELTVQVETITDTDFELTVEHETITDTDFELTVHALTIIDRNFELTVQAETITDTDFELTVIGITETIFDTDFELTVQVQTIVDTDFELTVHALTITDTDFELTVQAETITNTDFELTVIGNDVETIFDTDFELTVHALTITDTDFELTVQVETITDTDFELTVELETIVDTDFELTVHALTITDTDFKLNVTANITETIFDRDFELTVQVETITDTDFELTVEHETITDRDFELFVIHETITDTDFELTVQTETITDTNFELTVVHETITDTDFELTVQVEQIIDRNFYISVQTETIIDTDFELTVISYTIFDTDFEITVQKETITDTKFEMNVFNEAEVESLPIITIRDYQDPYDELVNIPFGDITAEGTSSTATFRVYNNFLNAANIWTAKDIKIGLSLFANTEIISVLRKELETFILDAGTVEIKCVKASELESVDPAVDWSPIIMTIDQKGQIFGYYYDADFDTISGETPHNFNEYQIRLNDFPDINVDKEAYSIELTVSWDDYPDD